MVLRRERMELALLQHQYDLIDLVVHHIQDYRIRRRRRRKRRRRETIMKPYSLRGLDNEERIFNYRLSRATRMVENAFGILANRLQVLLTTMQHHHSTVKVMVKACIVLHNLMRLRYLDSRTSISTVQRT